MFERAFHALVHIDVGTSKSGSPIPLTAHLVAGAVRDILYKDGARLVYGTFAGVTHAWLEFEEGGDRVIMDVMTLEGYGRLLQRKIVVIRKSKEPKFFRLYREEPLPIGLEKRLSSPSYRRARRTVDHRLYETLGQIAPHLFAELEKSRA